MTDPSASLADQMKQQRAKIVELEKQNADPALIEQARTDMKVLGQKMKAMRVDGDEKGGKKFLIKTPKVRGLS
jgi:hypothetical protein